MILTKEELKVFQDLMGFDKPEVKAKKITKKITKKKRKKNGIR
tara:strand:- start:366 stop:494 length:129 start_codon:yes stop_codon:yes gene_type:complete